MENGKRRRNEWEQARSKEGKQPNLKFKDDDERSDRQKYDYEYIDADVVDVVIAVTALAQQVYGSEKNLTNKAKAKAK